MAQALTLADVAFDFSAGSSAFTVVDFKGREAISKLFRFDLNLTCPDSSVDVSEVLRSKASFSIHRDSGQQVLFEGVVSSFEQRGTDASNIAYHAVLVPRLWQLTLTRRSRIFQDKTINDILADTLNEQGFTTDDYVINLTQSYPQREYVVQYQETDLAFLSRWMEREGIFYFFDGSQLVIADDPSIHRPIDGGAELVYQSAGGMYSAQQEAVSDLSCRQRMIQGKVILKDYNWRRPTVDLKAQQDVSDSGTGTLSDYGDHFKDLAEGTRLARVRSEAIGAREKVFIGTSDCRGLRAGFQFNISKHYQDEFNTRYLIGKVAHEGWQSGKNALESDQSASVEKPNYQNRFRAIPADIPFRSPRTTPRPHIGTVNAHIDASGDGDYAELDSQGRYKVILPFDLSGAGGGKASRFIRMAQPYAGADYGMHFPLHKGTEVILTHIDGDPDRPIITGAVPNPDTASPVTSANQTASMIKDHAGNSMTIEGTQGKEQITLQSPNNSTTLQLGGAIIASTAGPQQVQVQGESVAQIGKDSRTVVGGDVVEDLKKNQAVMVAKEQLVQATRIIIQADEELSIKVGGSFITLRNNHIGIEGATVDINAGDSAPTSSLLDMVTAARKKSTSVSVPGGSSWAGPASLTSADPTSFAQVPGFEISKIRNTSYVNDKYTPAVRVLSQAITPINAGNSEPSLPPTTESLSKVVDHAQANGFPDAKVVGDDLIDFGDGRGPVDVIFSVGSDKAHWQMLQPWMG